MGLVLYVIRSGSASIKKFQKFSTILDCNAENDFIQKFATKKTNSLNKKKKSFIKGKLSKNIFI